MENEEKQAQPETIQPAEQQSPGPETQPEKQPETPDEETGTDQAEGEGEAE